MAAAALAAALTACGAGDEPRSAEETARAWVRAVEERDWARVCALSTPEVPDCPREAERSFGDWKDPRLKRMVTDASVRFEVSTAGSDPPHQLLLEPHEDGHLVHLEVAVIR